MRLKKSVMVGSILTWTLAVIGVVLIEAFGLAGPVAPQGDVAGVETHLVQKLEQATAKTLGSAALLLIQNDEIVAAHSFGVANAETQAPVILDRTIYQLASVSKVVTAWGVMRLVEEGSLALDEPVLSYLTRWQFPVSNEYREQVTVRQLLSHTAGLDDRLGYLGFLPGEEIQTLEESLTLTQDPAAGSPRGVNVVREPGTVWDYSGGGYTLLQLLIEEVTGQTFADYMAEAVLQPLGMLGASFDWDAIASAGRAADLATSFDRQLNPTPHRRFTATAAASLYATPQDMAQFVRAYAGTNPVLSPATLAQMLLPQPGGSQDWGLGTVLYVPNGAGGYVVGHGGRNLPGLTHTVRVNPATGNGVVLMVSGNLGLANQLGHDWTYWETGRLTIKARIRRFRQRLLPASVVIVFGAIAIVLLSVLRNLKIV